MAKRLKEATTSVDIASFTVSVPIKDSPMEKWDTFIRELPDNEIIIPELRFHKDRADDRLFHIARNVS